MGKQQEQRQQPPAPHPERRIDLLSHCPSLSFRCVFVLLLALAASLSVLPSIISHRSRRADNRRPAAAIQASFVLHKPVSFLRPYTARLEYDIFEEIGVPNSKVSVISMIPLLSRNHTRVRFGVLPVGDSAGISPVARSLLRSSLVYLTIKQSNLSLTESIFGQPSSFNILKFPGGISVIPMHTAQFWKITRSLFSFKLNNSITDVLNNLNELKSQLKVGLSLKPYENVFVELKNLDGSTVTPPVTVQTSILSDLGSHSLLPLRLKQLAHVISGSERNLGLNHTLFGNVKEVMLSSYLNNSIIQPEPPSPSPSPASQPAAPPSDASPSPAPIHDSMPCCHCNGVAPAGRPSSLAPSPNYLSKPPTPPASSSHPPSVSPFPLSPRSSPNPPSSPPKVTPPVPAGVSPARSRSPAQNDNDFDNAPSSSLIATLHSSAISSNTATHTWTTILVLFLQFLWLPNIIE